MCLSYPAYYNATTNQDTANGATLNAIGKLATHSDDISCDNNSVYVARVKSGSLAVAQSIPIRRGETGASTIVFPIAPEHAANLRPCEALDCMVANYEGICQPEDYVEYVEEVVYTGVVYRSLSNVFVDDDADVDGAKTKPTLSDLRVIHNPDGGAVAIVPTAKHLPRTMTPTDRARLVTPMLDCIEAGVRAAGIDPRQVFGTDYDEDDPHTKFPFIGFLLDAMTPECDIVIGIMPAGKREGLFTFFYHDEHNYWSVPVLGLTHGDMMPMQRVEENFWLLCNDPSLRLTLPKDVPCSGESDKMGADVELIPPNAKEYVKTYFKVDYTPDDRNMACVHLGKRGPDSTGNHLWAKAQEDFQEMLIEDTHAKLNKFLEDCIGDTIESPESLHILNMKGMEIPRSSIAFTLSVDPRVASTPALLKRNQERLENRNALLKRKLEPSPVV